MPFNAQLSEISVLGPSEFMCQDSILQIFDHEQPTNLLDQGMLQSELDLLNDAFIQDSQISLRLDESDNRVLSNQSTLQTQNSILPNMRSLSLNNNEPITFSLAQMLQDEQTE
jgi:hypothetical protein